MSHFLSKGYISLDRYKSQSPGTIESGVFKPIISVADPPVNRGLRCCIGTVSLAECQETNSLYHRLMRPSTDLFLHPAKHLLHVVVHIMGPEPVEPTLL